MTGNVMAKKIESVGIGREHEDLIKSWLADYLFHHISGWADAYKENWRNEDIAAHIAEHNLVDQEFRDITEVAQTTPELVKLAYSGDQIIGIAYAETRVDRYMKLKIAALSWIYVDKPWRRDGTGRALLRALKDTLIDQGIYNIEIMVTDSNSAALALYKSEKFRTVDRRLLG